ncbi:hypothetical protein RB597_007568 [Gaeumannomyces tritici]
MASSQPSIPTRGEFILAGPETAVKGQKFAVPIVFRIRADEFPGVPVDQLEVEFHLVTRGGEELHPQLGAVMEPQGGVASQRAVRWDNGAAYFVVEAPSIHYSGWFGIAAKINSLRDGQPPLVVGRQVRQGMLKVERYHTSGPQITSEQAKLIANLKARGVLVDRTVSRRGTGLSQAETGCCLHLH